MSDGDDGDQQGTRTTDVAPGVTSAAVLSSLTDALAIVGPAGTVVWANQQAATLLALPLDELIGCDAFARVHPDEIERALDGVSWTAAFPDQTAVVPIRLRRGDGTYADVELKSTLVGAAGDHIALLLRDGSTRTTLARALAAVARGEPVEVTARWLCRAVAHRFAHTSVAIVWHDRHGLRVVADHMPTELEDALRVDDDRAGPWRDAMTSGEDLVVDVGSLPDALQAVAARHGIGACAVAPLRDGTRSAAVVAWFEVPDAARVEWRHWVTEVTDLLGLALEQEAHHRALEHAARHDPLTGLLNRIGLFEAVSALITRNRRPTAGELALLYLDLDGFKPVNDAHGHAAGDAVLAVVAERLDLAAPGAVVARLGGDEFAVVTDVEGEAGLAAVVDRLLGTIAKPIEVGVADGTVSVQVELSASIGSAWVLAEPSDGETEATAVRRSIDAADAAMYQAKAAGKSRWHRSN